MSRLDQNTHNAFLENKRCLIVCEGGKYKLRKYQERLNEIILFLFLVVEFCPFLS